MNYIIGSGYHYRSEWNEQFFEIWLKNTVKYSSHIYVASTVTEPKCKDYLYNCIQFHYNLGHVGEYCDGKRKGQLCGWSASIMALALIAYNSCKDFLYKESDCLWVGNVPEQAYKDLGDKQVVFGKKMESPPYMACAQSTFLVRHKYIPKFVSDYLALPDDKDMLPENKFVRLEESNPNEYTRLSFGVDRERPIPWDDPIWYCQQWTEDELAEFIRRGL